MNRPKIESTESGEGRLDILFLDPLPGVLPDYDSASVVEYLKANNFSAGYLSASSHLTSDEGYLAGLVNSKAHWLAVRVLDASFDESVRVIKKISGGADGFRIIPWGPGCRTEAQRRSLPLNLIYGMVLNEYEETFKDLLLSRTRGKSKTLVPGVYYPYEPYVPRSHIKNISRLPYPRYSEFELNDIDSLPLRISKGCPHRCTFCSTYYSDGPHRPREPGLVFEEIRHHLTENAVTRFVFQDRSMAGNLNSLHLMCDMIIQARYSPAWEGKFIVPSHEPEFLFDKMAAAGCFSLDFGFVSGSDRVLEKMGKPFNVNSLQRALASAKEYGICTSIKLMIGFPGEDEPAFNETVGFLRRNRSRIDRIEDIFPSILEPGCDLEVNPETYGITLPHIDHLRCWYDKSFNTADYRAEKAREMENIIKDLGIPFDRENLDIS